MKKFIKIIFGIVIFVGIIIGITLATYVKGLPYAVSHPKTLAYLESLTKKYTNADLKIENPILTTHLNPNVQFKVDKIILTKNNKKLLELNKFNSAVNLKDIITKKIIIKKLVAESIYLDVNNLQKIIPQKKKDDKKKSDWNVDIFEALLGVRSCEIIYSPQKDIMVHLLGKHIGVNNAEKVKKNVYFQLNSEIRRKDKKVTLNLNDNNKVYFEKQHFYIKNCPLQINKSNIFINLTADKKQNFNINLFSKNFKLNDVIDFLNTQIVENNVQDSLNYFSDINGNLDFKFNISNKDFNGKFTLNRLNFKVKDVDNLPITLTNGVVDLTTKNVKLTNFKGFYDNDSRNKIDFEGDVKDYLRTINTNITGNAIIRNDFFRTHLSKMTGTKLELKGEAPTRIVFKSKKNIMDFVWYFMLKPGQNIKVAQDYLPFEDSLRLMKSDMHFENMILDIKSLDYHMIPADKLPPKGAPRPKRNPNQKKPQPIFRLNSSIDVAHNSFIKYVGFEIPKPLPSELLNTILKQELFKKGEISGKMTLDNRGKYPYINGQMNMDKVIIPSQKTFIKQATLKGEDKFINIDAEGGYRRSKFSFNGKLLNEIKYPIVVKDANLSVNNIDIVKLLEAFNNKDSNDDIVATDEGLVKVDNDDDFDIRNVIIEKAKFHLDSGSYKEIEFSNLDADLTLNKDGIIDIKSNRFNFAQGFSSLVAQFDLINNKYNVKLGIKEVNSDIIANALLDLKREITGKANGFLDISTDKTAKLSGKIKFIVQNGTIEKIGLVEYVLKCASLLRNTVSMINPAIFADIVNVPEGNFDKITGDLTLKDNIVTGIKIKTSSPQLSNYVAGRYNIDNGDTSLRIYTKFSNTQKGFSGFLRKISLSSLANRIPINSRSDANYYAVELEELPPIDANEKDCQIYLTRVEGDVVNNNYISSLKKIK